MFEHVDLSLRFVAILLTLVGIQLVLGKKAAFPYGLVMGLSPVFVGLIVLVQDIAQTPLIISLLGGSSRLRWLEKWRRKLMLDEERLKNYRWMRWIKHMQHLGIVLIVSTPFAGGIWTGCLLSHAFGLRKLNSFVMITIGSAIGTVIFVLSFIGIVHWLS
jgi:uncharacterized membrane protein